MNDQYHNLAINNDVEIKDFRLELKIKNNKIFTKIEQFGYRSVSMFCKKNNFSASRIGDFINFKISPLTKKGV